MDNEKKEGKDTSKAIKEIETVSQEIDQLGKDIVQGLDQYENESDKAIEKYNQSKENILNKLRAGHEKSENALESKFLDIKSSLLNKIESAFSNLNKKKGNKKLALVSGFILFTISIYVNLFLIMTIPPPMGELIILIWNILAAPAIVAIAYYLFSASQGKLNYLEEQLTQKYNELKEEKFNKAPTEIFFPIDDSLTLDKNNSMKERIKQFAKDIANKATKVSPVAKEFTELTQWEARYQYFVDKANSTILYFKIPVTQDFFTKILKKEIPYADMLDEDWDDLCFKKISEHLKRKNFNISPYSLRILHAEHNGKSTRELWRNKTKANVEEISDVLLNTSYLSRDKDGNEFYNKEDIISILIKSDDFNLTALNSKLISLERFVEYSQAFSTFLSDNKLPVVCYKLSKIEESLNPTRNFEENLINILNSSAKEAINEKYKTMSDDKVGGFSLFSLALFFSENLSLRPKICVMLSKDNFNLELCFAYNELRQKLAQEGKIGNDTNVHVSALIENYETILALRKKELPTGVEKEIEKLKILLADGIWINSSAQLTLETITDLQEEVKIKAIFVRLKSLFKELLRPQVLERFLQTKTVTAYIVTFKTLTGPAAGLLDLLADEKNEKRIKQITGVECLTPGSQKKKYRFEKYTDSTRIGIIPREMSFEQFTKQFESDLDKLYIEREQILPDEHWQNKDFKDLEIIINKFEPSSYNYYQYKTKETENIVKEEAVKKIKDLLAEELKGEEFVSLIKYQGENLLEAFLNAPISELVQYDNNLGLKGKEIELLSKDKIKELILKETSFTDISTLAKYLADRGKKDIDDAKKALGKTVHGYLIKEGLTITEKKSNRIADTYVQTIIAVAKMAPE